jgi:glycosyltransferase involved in cell wall biosynthesis
VYSLREVKFSVVIPARDEEKLIGACLESVLRAAVPYPGDVELIVVVNRCTDSTESNARAHGARIVRDDSRCLARIRNAGAREAAGDILVTMDADSTMSPNMLSAIERKLTSGRFVGGGVPIRSDRMSLGIFVAGLILWTCLFATGLSGGLYWCYRRDFEAIGGFNEAVLVGEDLEFAKRLKDHGRRQERRFGVLWGAHIVTSARKFDRFGDWFVLRMLLNPRALMRAARGDRAFADRYFYDFEH